MGMFESGRCYRPLLLATTAMIAMNDAALAQTVGAHGEQALIEVVVTAQKRPENLQDTPISISVLDDSALSNRHAQSLEDLGDGSIPSLRVAPFFSRSSALSLGMRGIGSMADANQPSRDQGVGVYVDGVYLGRAQGLGTALFDVARIEVLKGPQGTLFGRNTEGGAIAIVTKKPTGEWGLTASASYGNFDGHKLEAHLNLPSIANVAVKLDGLFSQRNGTVDNPLAGQLDMNSYNKRGFRAEALWTPTDGVSVDYSYDIARDRTSPYYVQLLSKGLYPTASLISTQPDRAKTSLLGVPMAPSIGNTEGHGVTIDWHPLDNLEVKSITSLRFLSQSQRDNASFVLSVFAPNATFGRYSLSDMKQHQLSQEVQLVGELPQVHYVGGIYYYREYAEEAAFTPNTMQWNSTGTAYSVLSTPVAAWSYPDRSSNAVTESVGLFAQAIYTPSFLDNRAHLTLGGRYTNDTKTGTLSLVNGAVPVVNGVSAVQHLDKSWDHVDPLVTLAYDVTEDFNLYGKWSSGYKAGGANSRSLTYRAFNPEKVKSFEFGFKSEFLDHHARLNVAGYFGDYKNVQIDFNAVIPGNNRGTIETANAPGTADIHGAEIELTVTPIDGVTVTGSYSRTEINLPAAPNPFAANALVAVYPLYAPKNAAAVSADYVASLGFAKLNLHADANYSDGQYTSSSDPTLSQSGLIVNGKIGLSDIALGNGNFALSLWARNLFDEQHLFYKNYNAALGTYGIFNDPRTFGVELSTRF